MFVLLACGGTELVARGFDKDGPGLGAFSPVFVAGAAAATGGIASLVWVTLKVGALSYGGGVRHHPADASRRRRSLPLDDERTVPRRGGARSDHPGPVVQTVAVVGYAAAGVGGGLLAAAVAFSPSFLFIVVGRATSTACGPTRRATALPRRRRSRRHRRDLRFCGPTRA